MSATRPLPLAHADDLPFWEAARQHELRLPHCLACEETWWPASPVCPACFSDQVEWKLASGRGRVASWVVFHKVYFAGFADRVPYNVAWVELEEGPRLTANLLNVEPDAIRVGMQVRVVFERLDDTWTLPQFEPTTDESKE